MSGKSERENYYLLLDLDPAVTDWQPVKDQITQKRNAWMLRGDTKHRNLADLALKAEIYLKDDEARIAEANAAKRQYEERLDDYVTIHSQGGRISQKSYRTLIDDFKGKLNETEVRNRIATLRIQILSKPPLEPAPNRISPAIQQKIEDNLQILEQEDLYTFLSSGYYFVPAVTVTARNTAVVLEERTQVLARAWRQVQKRDTKSTARNELLAICAQAFKDQIAKEGYDNYLAIAPMKQLDDLYERLGRGVSIPLDTMEHLLKRAEDKGVEPSVARSYLNEVAFDRDWVLPRDSQTPYSNPTQRTSPTPRPKPEPTHPTRAEIEWPDAQNSRPIAAPIPIKQKRETKPILQLAIGLVLLCVLGALVWQPLRDRIQSGGAQSFTAKAQAQDWDGGYPVQNDGTYGRPWTAVHGKGSSYESVSLTFTVATDPIGEAWLRLMGLDDEYTAKPGVTVMVNEHVIYDDGSPFDNPYRDGQNWNYPWKEVAIRIPAGVLRSGQNSIKVKLNNSANSNEPPFILLGQAVIEYKA